MRNQHRELDEDRFLRGRRSRSGPLRRCRAALLAIGVHSASLLGCSGNLYGFVEDVEPEGSEPTSARRPDAGVADAGADAAEPPALTQEWLSNEAMLELLRDYKYRGAGFRSVNERPFPSTVAPGKSISLWISEASVDAYRQVAPERAGSKVALPAGTVIVREVLDGATLTTITVMLRLPDGAFPLGGDWWYASAAPDGTINRNADDGTPIIGLLEDCGTCHLRRSNDDYLFGTPDGYLE